MTDDARRRQRVRVLQRYLVNPPYKSLVMLGLVPGHMLVETRGRKTGKRRRTVVGYHRDGNVLWVVSEQGRYAGYVRNIEASPGVRLRLQRRWVTATGTVVDGDDPIARLQQFDAKHAAVVKKMGTALLTLRFDLEDGTG